MGTAQKSSLRDKILAIREGDYKNCFREGEGKHFLERRREENVLSPYFFKKNIFKRDFFLIFSQKISKCLILMLLQHQGGGDPWKFFLSAIGGVCVSKIALGWGGRSGGDCHRLTLQNTVPHPSPPYGEEAYLLINFVKKIGVWRGLDSPCPDRGGDCR